MKIFLKNTILFLVVLYASIFAIIVITNYVIHIRANFKLKPETTKIIIGNSQPEAAYNDSLIPSLKNLANAGESYFYGYQKLKEVLKQNPQINTIYIEFNPTTILIREDDKIWTDRYIKYQVPNNLAFFDFYDHKLLITHNSIGYQQSVLKSLKSNLKRMALSQYNFIDSVGGYRTIKWSHTASILDTLKYDHKTQYKLEQKKTSTYDIIYLKKMVDLCKKKNIEVNLIRSPYHEKFIGRKYETLFQEYRKKNFRDVDFLDFKDFKIDDSEFGDLQHLNYKGARRFSLWFGKYISTMSL
jgi:hypothetical protein